MIDHSSNKAKECAHDQTEVDKCIVILPNFQMHTPYNNRFLLSIDIETTDNATYTDEYQLQIWAYETSDAEMTVAERLEKANWEAGRLERL
jgi:hypothetical protein